MGKKSREKMTGLDGKGRVVRAEEKRKKEEEERRKVREAAIEGIARILGGVAE